MFIYRRKVVKDQAQKYKEDYNIDNFMETSAKTGFNAKNLFINAAKLLYGDFCKYKTNIEKVYFNIEFKT
jgi:hypothetical protein